MVLGFAMLVFHSAGLAYFSDTETGFGSFKVAEPQPVCKPLGKIEDIGNGIFSVELDDENDANLDEFLFLLRADDGTGNYSIIEIDPTEWKENEENELLTFNFTVLEGSSICSVLVKGGPEIENYSIECEDIGLNLKTPSYGGTPPNPAKGISHIEFYYCDWRWPE